MCVGMCGGNRDLERKKANFEWCLSHEIQVFRVLKFRVFGAERERERERERETFIIIIIKDEEEEEGF